MQTMKDTSIQDIQERISALEKKLDDLQQTSTKPSTPSVQFSGLAYLYYSYSLEGTDGRYANKFDFDRMYLTAQGTITNDIKYVYTTDVYRDTALNEDYGLSIRVKLAYFDYAPVSEVSIKGGVIPNMWTGFVDSYWKYRGISTNFVDKNGFYKSTDLGVSGQYSFPGKLGDVSAYILNGDGYSSREQNRFKDVAARLNLTPFKEIPVLNNMTFAGYGYKGANATTTGVALQKDRAGFLIGYADSYFSVYAEGEKRWDGAVKPDSVITGSGISFFGEIKTPMETLKNKFSLVVRLDVCDPNVNKGGDMSRFVILGAAYHCNDKFVLVLDNQSLFAETSTMKVVNGTKVDYDGRWFIHTIINF
ncbi:MAG TPA: hypothetical protein VMU30_06650 [Bacteroidota bacterium]|nr:hypothetical protein [Bacteroidota bacterium]